MSVSNMPLLVNIQTAIRISGLSRSTLYRRLATQEIRAKKLGRTTLVETKSLHDFVERLPDARFHRPKSHKP